MQGPPPTDLNLGLIGNCSVAALVDRRARIVWSCFSRFDGDPVFCSLLNGSRADHEPTDAEEIGFWSIDLEDLAECSQAYRRNSGVLVTTLTDREGQIVEVVDFAPRFRHFGRMHRPTSLMRRVHAISGSPRVRIRCRPRFEYGTIIPEVTRGSNHMRFVGPEMTLRLTTDASVSFIADEVAFVLDRPLHFLFGADESLTAPLPETVNTFLQETDAYWREFSRYLALPFEWQDAVMRAAIALKMCSYEETGAIVAAVTTSVPEAPNTTRNWDYRYCWLRDAYFSVHALNRLGATRTMEDYLSYITNIVTRDWDGHLQPMFGIGLVDRRDEVDAVALAGYRGMGPVRIGNQAFNQVQNDSYGSIILAATQAFFDRRLDKPGDEHLFQRLEKLGGYAVEVWDKPDAGPWELRTRSRVHTFSAVMCWAGCDRLAKIAHQLELMDRAQHWRAIADDIRTAALEKAFNEKLNSFVESFGGNDLDASALLMHEIGIIEPEDPRFLGTIAASERYLKRGEFLFRYHAADDFGEPDTAFTICTFWYIDALAAVGRIDEARALFERMLEMRNHVGLLSEDIDPRTGELWGNYPQTYSLVGLMNSAMRLSKPWEEAF